MRPGFRGGSRSTLVVRRTQCPVLFFASTGEVLMARNTHLVSRVKTFFQENAARYHVGIALIYGSRALGYAREDSDLDLAIVFSPDLSDDQVFILMTQLSTKLSDFLGMEVNILPLYSDFRQPMLYYNAIVHGILVYSDNFGNYVDLKLHALQQMEDFSVFGVRWQIEVTQKNLEELDHG